MLLRSETLAAIRTGRVTLQFRRWTRSSVKAGGTLLTAVGQLAIDSVDVVDEASLTDADAQAAGFEDATALRAQLDARPDRTDRPVYRIHLRWLGEDPRIALRQTAPDAHELAEIRSRLDRWDAASPVGPWTGAALRIIEAMPETRAGDLAAELDVDKQRFKVNVRKLKGLGLTESLEIGYRLSPRGRAVLRALDG